MDWNLGNIGSFLGGMGQFAGGAAGLFGGQGNGSFDAHDSYKMRVRQALYMPTYMRRGAEAAGFHPLALLGMNPASGVGGIRVGERGTGRALANMGQGLQRAMAGQSELQKAQAKYYDALTDDIRRKDTPPIPGISEEDISDKPAYQTPVKATSFSGYETGSQALSKFAVDEDGYVEKGPTEGMEDYISESFLGKLRYDGLQVARGVNTWIGTQWPFNKREGGLQTRQNLRKRLNKLERAMRAAGKLKNDEYLTWSLGRMQPRRVKLNKFKHKQLFDSREKHLYQYAR